MNLSKIGKVTRVSNAIAAGTGTTNCSSVDMKGFDSVTFYLLLGDVGVSSPPGTVQLKAQQAEAEDSPETYADLLGTGQTVTTTGDNKVLILEVASPRERFIRPVLVRTGGTAVIDGVIAIQTQSYDEPITHDVNTVAGSEFHLSPDEGVA